MAIVIFINFSSYWLFLVVWLNEVTTFSALMNTDVEDLNDWLNAADWHHIDPKTWPYQAELAEKAKVSDKKEDQEEFDKYKAWAKDGIAPDEYNVPEDDRSDEVKKTSRGA